MKYCIDRTDIVTRTYSVEADSEAEAITAAMTRRENGDEPDETVTDYPGLWHARQL